MNRPHRCGSSGVGAGPPQRSLLGEYVARAEFGGTSECQILAHTRAIELRYMPRMVEIALRLKNPIGYGCQSVLPRQVFGSSAEKRIEMMITGIDGTLGNRRQSLRVRQR